MPEKDNYKDNNHEVIAAQDLLTVEQAAVYLQFSPSSIRAYIRKGNLKAFRIAGKRKVLIPRAELNVLLRQVGTD